MTDLVGRIGPSHPAHSAYPPAHLTDSPVPVAHALAVLRGQLRDLADELETDGHHGCAELLRARVWNAAHSD